MPKGQPGIGKGLGLNSQRPEVYPDPSFYSDDPLDYKGESLRADAEIKQNLVFQELDELKEFANGNIPFTLPYFVKQFCPDDPIKANLTVFGLAQNISDEHLKIERLVDRLNNILANVVDDPKALKKSFSSLRMFEAHLRGVVLSQSSFIGLITAEAFRMGRHSAQLTLARVLDSVVLATAHFAETELDAGADRERILKAGGLISDKAPISINTGANFNAPTQINQGMQLPRLSDTTGEIHSQVMEERRRMLDKPDLSGIIETEVVKREKEEGYESQTIR